MWPGLKEPSVCVCVVVYCVIFIQVLIIESTGKRVLLLRGYLCMAASLALLTLTLYLQVCLFFIKVSLFNYVILVYVAKNLVINKKCWLWLDLNCRCRIIQKIAFSQHLPNLIPNPYDLSTHFFAEYYISAVFI